MRSTIFCALFFFTSVGRAQGVHAVDFANRVWTHTCVGRVRTHRGVSSDWQPGGDDRAFRVDAPVFGDLDGDGRDEAVVRTHCAPGYVNHFGDAIVFAWRGGQLREIAHLGVRADGRSGDGGRDTLNAVRIEGGAIVEERPVDRILGSDTGYVIVHRRVLLAGRLVEPAPPTVACRPASAATCVPPAEQSSEVHFQPSHMAATRPMTFDASGDLPTLSLRLHEGQDLHVDFWCDSTEPALMRVEPPEGDAVESDSTVGWMHALVERSGRYRVVLRARQPVGVCYVRLGAHAVASAR